MSHISEHEQAVLTVDLPELGLRAGDVGVIVLVHNHGEAYEVEFLTAAGSTIDVLTLQASQVRPLQADDMMHVRRRAG